MSSRDKKTAASSSSPGRTSVNPTHDDHLIGRHDRHFALNETSSMNHLLKQRDVSCLDEMDVMSFIAFLVSHTAYNLEGNQEETEGRPVLPSHSFGRG